MGATAAAVTAEVFAVTFVLTAAALTVVCAEAFGAALVSSACVGLAEDLGLVLDLDEGLAVVLDLFDPDVSLPPMLSWVLPFGVVDELPVRAPPLLLTITPEATSVLDEVDPDVADVDDDPLAPELPVALVASVVPVVPVVPAVPVAPVVAVDPDVAPFTAPDVPPDELEEPEDVEPLDELDELDDAELADPPAVSATATPWPVVTAVTSQAATARPP